MITPSTALISSANTPGARIFIEEQTTATLDGECPLCGMEVHGKHPAADCDEQRRKNQENISRKLGCRWCGSAVHQETCPKYKKDEVSVRHEGRTTVITTECGYCHATSESSHTEPDARGFGGASSMGGIQHRFGCPKFVTVMA